MTAWTRLFAQPWALWLLTALPALSLLLAWARHRRRLALAQLGTPYLVARLVSIGARRRALRTLLITLGLTALLIGAAGPRWGMAASTELLNGKDILVVVDLSKSMLAEQPSRLERARRSLLDLTDTLEARGGHRVGLVVFAAHAKLLFPLTGDYDHVRFAVAQLDAEAVPPALRPNADEQAVSGTRMGEALALATASHDLQRVGRQDILLLSDGDDPAADEEWLRGVQAARLSNIPVHVVAIGDPREAHRIPLGNDVVRHDGAPVQSRLNETLLQEIARRTEGIYLPAHERSLLIGRLLGGYLEAPPKDAANGAAEYGVEAKLHYSWFFAAALVLLGAAMLMGDGVRPAAERRPTAGRMALAGAAALLVSAEPLSQADESVRQGNAAFARRDYEEAVRRYGSLQAQVADPGLVAFNEGAAFFRLGRFEEAVTAYRRCLDDQLIPVERKARANYDLGTTLLRAGPDNRRRLEESMAALRACLESAPSDELRRDAVHNLELAKWLWVRARPAPGSERANDVERPVEHAPPKENIAKSGNERESKTQSGAEKEGTAEKKGTEGGGADAKEKKLTHGPLNVLPDETKLVALPPEETAAHLDDLVERIRRQRRTAWQATPLVPGVKDW